MLALVLAVAFSAAPPSPALRDRVPRSLRDAALDVRDAQARLRLELPEDEESAFPPVDIPAAAAHELARLKAGLRALAAAGLSSMPGALPPAVRDRVVGELLAAGVRVGESAAAAREPGVGSIVELSLGEVEEAAGHVTVLARVGIPCGDDATLEVHRLESGVPVSILVRSNDGYESISEALGGYDFRLGKSGSGELLAMDAWVAPWCSSNWQGLLWGLWRPGRHGALRSGEAQVFGRDDPFRLSREEDRFELRYETWHGLDAGRLTREDIVRVDLSGELEAETLTSTPDGFVARWIETDAGDPSGEPVRIRRRIRELMETGWGSEVHSVTALPGRDEVNRVVIRLDRWQDDAVAEERYVAVDVVRVPGGGFSIAGGIELRLEVSSEDEGTSCCGRCAAGGEGMMAWPGP